MPLDAKHVSATVKQTEHENRWVPPHTLPNDRPPPLPPERKRGRPPPRGGTPKPAPNGTRSASASNRAGKSDTKEDTQPSGGALWAAEARRLGVDPAKWVLVQKHWSETDDANQEDTLDGYEYGTLTRRDLKTLK